MNVLWLHLTIFGAVTVSLPVLIAIFHSLQWGASETRWRRSRLQNVGSQDGNPRHRCTLARPTPLTLPFKNLLKSD